MIDEGPSAEDLERFSDDTAHCPFCGAEIWDEADICPKCRNYIGGDTLSKHPIQRTFEKKWITLVIIALILGMLAFLWAGFV